MEASRASRELPARAPVTVIAAVFALLVSCSGSERAPSGGAEETWTRIDPATLDDMLRTDDVFLVNVHVPYEGEIPSTDAFISYDEITSHLDELPTDPANVVIYCRSGNMSTTAAQALVDAGVTGFSELEGGYEGWRAAGLPFSTSGK